MSAWKANIDIQFCMDSYAVITYISDYMTKGDAGLTKELRKALLETKHCNNFEQLDVLTCLMTIKKLLIKTEKLFCPMRQ